jgi:hypothetical protein
LKSRTTFRKIKLETNSNLQEGVACMFPIGKDSRARSKEEIDSIPSN